jgi:hypothetical protein
MADGTIELRLLERHPLGVGWSGYVFAIVLAGRYRWVP